MVGVAVAGCGVVGSGVVKMLTENHDRLVLATGGDITLKFIVDIRPVDAPEGVVVTGDIDRVLNDPDIKVLAETIGGARIAYDYTRKALEKGVNVITSNKELVARKGDELKEIARAHGAWYLYEAAVCGGAPVLRPLKTDLAANRVLSLNGIVNGSTNYLLTRMEDEKLSFPAALGAAKALGYLEADPSADLEGLDARRKLAILANAAFGSRLSDDELIPTTGIDRITDRDLACARLMGGAAKLIAHAQLTPGGWTGWIHPGFAPKNHPLYPVRDVFNGLCVEGDFVGSVMFYGRGAGMKPTASALMGDLVELSRSIEHPLILPEREIVPFVSPDEVKVRAVLRVEGDVEHFCEVIAVEDIKSDGPMNAVLTSELTFGELKERTGFARRLGMEVGIPLIEL